MSKEYIERETLLDQDFTYKCINIDDISVVEKLIKNVPAADVEPVIHATWKMIEEENFWIHNMEESLKTGKPTKTKLPVCSHCKTKFGTLALDYKRCPECGAIMDGGNKANKEALSRK